MQGSEHQDDPQKDAEQCQKQVNDKPDKWDKSGYGMGNHDSCEEHNRLQRVEENKSASALDNEKYNAADKSE